MSLAAGPLGRAASLLEREQPWQSADKLKAIRLLGCYPSMPSMVLKWRSCSSPVTRSIPVAASFSMRSQ